MDVLPLPTPGVVNHLLLVVLFMNGTTTVVVVVVVVGCCFVTVVNVGFFNNLLKSNRDVMIDVIDWYDWLMLLIE